MVSRAEELFRRGACDETFGAEMRVISKSGKFEGIDRRGFARASGFLTSPRLRGEVGSHRRCDPGEGVQVSRQSLLGEMPLSPTLSPQARGEGAHRRA